MTPYVTIYNQAGDSRLIYRSSLNDWLATGDWSVEKPENAVKPAALKKAQLPTAGRAGDRAASVEALESAMPEAAAPAATEPEEVHEAPAKPAPRRRKPSTSEE